MTKSYSQLLKQIDTLKREAEDVRRNEIAGVVDRIKEAVKAYGLTAADLGLGQRAAKAPRKAAKAPAGRKGSKAAAVIKYRDEAGNTWAGRGARPAWLRAALASGKQLADFAV